MALAIIALFIPNLSGAWAGGDDAWQDPTSATTLLSLSASIGDRVWHDESGNGDQNENCIGSICVPEPGLNGVEVHLYRDNGDGVFDRNTDTFLGWTTTSSGSSQDPDGWLDGIYDFEIGPGDYWVWVDENTLPTGDWTLTSGSNPQKVTYTGDNDFSIDFGYEPLASPAPPISHTVYLPCVFFMVASSSL